MSFLSENIPIYSSPVVSSQQAALSSTDVYQGVVLWLAPYEETTSCARRRGVQGHPVTNLTTGIPAERKFYGHPILVLSRPATEPNIIHFLLMTTFGGQRIDKRFKTKYGMKHHRREYLSMAPAPDHPLLEQGNPLYQTLTFVGKVPGVKKGYLKVSEVHSMDWRDAQPRWNSNSTTPHTIRLSSASMRVVVLSTSLLAGYSPVQQFNYNLASLRDASSRAPVPSPYHVPDRSWSVIGVGPSGLQATTVNAASEARWIRESRSISVSSQRLEGGYAHCYEEEPLLPAMNTGSSRTGIRGARSWWTWLWDYLKRTRLGIIIGFVCCCIW